MSPGLAIDKYIMSSRDLEQHKDTVHSWPPGQVINKYLIRIRILEQHKDIVHSWPLGQMNNKSIVVGYYTLMATRTGN